jgi:hypothetical protein
MRFLFLLPVASLLMLSCKGSSKLSDQELIEKNVRAYFFMGDSVDVQITITDTVKNAELDEMILTIEENIKLIQLDIDTLHLMVDDWTYKAMDQEKAGDLTASQHSKIKSLEYRLKLQELEFRQAEFAQTNRIFMHLKRSVWADIAGFEANVHYQLGEEVNDIVILMDADYNLVD